MEEGKQKELNLELRKCVACREVAYMRRFQLKIREPANS